MKNMYIRFGLPMTVTGVAKDTLLKRILKNYENGDSPVSIVRLDGEGHPFIDKIPASDTASFFDKVLSGICT
jgi:6-phosphogluconolactonase/glucosamine-6-phosphate isomerase/deaminase